MVVNVFISAVTTDTLSRKEAVAWINDNLKTHFTKVEEMSTGAAYCQLTHLLFPTSINLRKVKFNPRSEPDILNNWKVLTVAWKNLGIDKPVDVEKMKKGKFQDNMEFLQWFYKFYNANITTDPEEYDAVGSRFGEDLPALKGTNARPAAPPVRAAIVRPAAAAPKATASPAQPSPPVATVAPARNGARVAPATSAGTRPPVSPELDALRKKNEELELVATEWEKMAKDMEAEREYYFAMLQKVEGLVHEADELKATSVELSALKSVLYEEVPEEVAAEDTVAPTNGNAHNEALIASLDDTETF